MRKIKSFQLFKRNKNEDEDENEDNLEIEDEMNDEMKIEVEAFRDEMIKQHTNEWSDMKNLKASNQLIWEFLTEDVYLD